jgi:hypothetical protein
MLETGKIRPSKSPASLPIFFVPTAHGNNLRLWINCRAINTIPIPHRYPLHIMTELKIRVHCTKIFTKIDLKHSYQLIRIKEEDQWKTSLCCRYGLYEILIMSFGLTNTLAKFQDMMNQILNDLLDKGIVVHIDNILIYAKNT